MNRSMESGNFLEGQSTQKPPLFENDNFCEWKNKFENYVKSIDQDLWHIISIGDLQKTKTDFENQYNHLQTKIDKKTKAKLMIYKTLPRVEYERVIFCKTASDIWKCLLNFHQGKCWAKDDKLDIAQELVVLEDLVDKHLVEINTSATSSNVFIEGINGEEYMSQIWRKIVKESWSNTYEEDDHNMVCEDIQIDETTSIDGEDYMRQDLSKFINETWSDMDDEEDHHMVCEDCEAYKATKWGTIRN